MLSGWVCSIIVWGGVLGLEFLAVEVNRWIAVVGGLTVVLTVGVVLQRWHEYKVRGYLRESVGLLVLVSDQLDEVLGRGKK